MLHSIVIRINEKMDVKCLAQCLALSKHSINFSCHYDGQERVSFYIKYITACICAYVNIQIYIFPSKIVQTMLMSYRWNNK